MVGRAVRVDEPHHLVGLAQSRLGDPQQLRVRLGMRTEPQAHRHNTLSDGARAARRQESGNAAMRAAAVGRQGGRGCLGRWRGAYGGAGGACGGAVRARRLEWASHCQEACVLDGDSETAARCGSLSSALGTPRLRAKKLAHRATQPRAVRRAACRARRWRASDACAASLGDLGDLRLPSALRVSAAAELAASGGTAGSAAGVVLGRPTRGGLEARDGGGGPPRRAGGAARRGGEQRDEPDEVDVFLEAERAQDGGGGGGGRGRVMLCVMLAAAAAAALLASTTGR